MKIKNKNSRYSHLSEQQLTKLFIEAKSEKSKNELYEALLQKKRERYKNRISELMIEFRNRGTVSASSSSSKIRSCKSNNWTVDEPELPKTTDRFETQDTGNSGCSTFFILAVCIILIGLLMAYLS